MNEMINGWKKDFTGEYSKTLNRTSYTVAKNEDTGEWHLRVDGEWSAQVETLRHGKYLAVAKHIGAV